MLHYVEYYKESIVIRYSVITALPYIQIVIYHLGKIKLIEALIGY